MKLKDKLAKLIDVKSIMTLLLTLVFCILALIGVISGEQFLTIFVTVVGFYFGTQSQKRNAETKPDANASEAERSVTPVELTHPPDQE